MPSQRYNNLTEKIQRAQTLLDMKQIKDLSYNPMTVQRKEVLALDWLSIYELQLDLM